MKTCSKCGLSKEEAEFYRSFAMKDGLQGQCRKCCLKHSQEWAKNNPDKIKQYTKERYGKTKEVVRKYCNTRYSLNPEVRKRCREQFLKRKYGLSMAEFDALRVKQDGKCAICRRTPVQTLSIDHCHITGRVRGLLCRACNTGLGYFRESQEDLLRAIYYLRGKL